MYMYNNVFIDNNSCTVQCKLNTWLFGTNNRLRRSLLFGLFFGFSSLFDYGLLCSVTSVIKLHIYSCATGESHQFHSVTTTYLHKTLTFHICYLSNLLGEGATMNKHPDSITSFNQKKRQQGLV